ncbi:vacuolar protein sorting-associated protein 33A [Hyposmocoma kahamanoa]|uniref:vacuolar protein sorting-associated protein 33A n=1 Tax=Hyposmocoma kahamanoa TaxID=1477025 RepID=UPI000E6D8608|nr:vacuolar protein sorting-associated protein 33A [Hyposmocoma kahamanoa]XP_026314253.1 vacuolar protein sorting-associated protein 33A [Hyposmocoma kahamanoa]
MKESKMSTHLSGGRLNVALVQETMRKDLLNLLQLCEGPKVTIWDEWLAGPVGLVAQYALLKEHEVTDMFPLRPGSLPTISVKHIVFIARPKLVLMDLVADYIISLRAKQNLPVEFHLFFVPRKSELCEKHLTNRGIINNLTIQEFKCDIFPFDSDVMSLELQNDFRENYLEGDPTCIYNAAQAIRTIQQLYGIIPRVFGKGTAAKQVWDLLCKLNKEEQGTEPKGSPTSCIDHLLLLDRAVDFTSVMATQLTYEGLIDELFGIKNSTATFPEHKFISPEDPTPEATAREKRRIILNSSEELFAELRDCNFTAVGAALSKKAHLIKTQLDERHNEKSVQEIKQFVSRLPQMLANKQSLATHTAIAEYIKETIDTFDFHDTVQCEEDFLNCVDNEKVCSFIEDLIAQKVPLTKILRLICLQCVTGSGLKPKVLEYYKKELVQVYGLKTWLTLCNFEKCGLLKPQTGSRQYNVLRKTLHLTMDESDLEREKSYLSSKYTPLTVRLSEHIAKNKGWSGIQDVLNLLPGPTVDELQTLQPRMARRNSISSDNSSSAETPRVILVFFLGGCTYNEISALRSISQQEDSNVEFVILTTKLINGNTFVESLMDID